MENNGIWSKIKNEPTSIKISMITNVFLYLLVSSVSLFHAFNFFFEATEPSGIVLAILATIAFEIGQIASLFSLNTLKKSNKTLIWSLFIFLTVVQVISNIGYGFYNINFAEDKYFNALNEFFSFIPSLDKYIKHIVTFLYSGSLPIIAVLFIKSLINYIAPSIEIEKEEIKKEVKEEKDIFSFESKKDYSEKPIESKKDIKTDIVQEEIIKPIEKETKIIIKENIDQEIENQETIREEIKENLSIEEFPIIEEIKESVIKEEAKVIVKEEIKPIEIPKNKVVKEDKNKTKVKIIEQEGHHSFKDIDKSKLVIF